MSNLAKYFESADEEEIKTIKIIEKKYCSKCDKKINFKIENPQDVKDFMNWLDLTYNGKIFSC